MMNDFNILARDLRKSKDAAEIARLQGEVLTGFATALQAIENSAHSPKIRQRLAAKLEEELFELGVDLLYETTSVLGKDVELAKQRFETSQKLLGKRMESKQNALSPSDTQRMGHTAGLVAKHFAELAGHTSSLTQDVRAEYKSISRQSTTFTKDLRK